MPFTVLHFESEVAYIQSNSSQKDGLCCQEFDCIS